MSGEDWQRHAEQLALRGGKMQAERDAAHAAHDRLVERIEGLCGEVDVDSYEAQQGWLVAKLRAALDGPDE